MGKYKDKTLDNEKYNLMGISPKELYLRQTNKCWLKVVVDTKVDDDEPQTTVYCTDGEEYAETSKMLNPTFECVRCLTNCILKMSGTDEEH